MVWRSIAACHDRETVERLVAGLGDERDDYCEQFRGKVEGHCEFYLDCTSPTELLASDQVHSRQLTTNPYLVAVRIDVLPQRARPICVQRASASCYA